MILDCRVGAGAGEGLPSSSLTFSSNFCFFRCWTVVLPEAARGLLVFFSLGIMASGGGTSFFLRGRLTFAGGGGVGWAGAVWLVAWGSVAGVDLAAASCPPPRATPPPTRIVEFAALAVSVSNCAWGVGESEGGTSDSLGGLDSSTDELYPPPAAACAASTAVDMIVDNQLHGRPSSLLVARRIF